MAGLYQLVSTRIRLEVGSDKHQLAHSANCEAVMAWIFVS
jgi:hypothetical protein